LTSEFKINKEVRQGCALSSSLIDLYRENIFKELAEMTGVNIGGTDIDNLRYADGTCRIC